MIFRVQLFLAILVVLLAEFYFSEACLITNCPRGGKRSGKFNSLQELNVKPCVSCGLGHSGQCFGPEICCGPFGCLVGTAESLKCQKEGNFHDSEPCIAGTMPCRKNTGRCASEGVCCSQDACFSDKTCTLNGFNDDKTRLNMDLLNNLLNQFESE